MPTYHFALRHPDEGEDLGYFDLPNDDEAFNFGRETIRLIMQDDPSEYAASVLHIREGDRAAGELPLGSVADLDRKQQSAA